VSPLVILIHSKPKEARRALSRSGLDRGRWPIRALAASVLCMFAAAMSAAAGTISIQTEVKATVQAGKLAVAVNVLNSGDETARSVVAAASFGSRDVRAAARPALAPGASTELALELPWSQATPGQWPLTTTVDYADENGYPFQSLQVSLVSSPDASPALIVLLAVNVKPVASTGGISVRLKSLSALTRDALTELLHTARTRGRCARPAVASGSLGGRRGDGPDH
jgi:CARDB protein